jgi:hypothetical protein
MSHSGAITFGDLINKLGTLRVTCDQCGRKELYSVRRLANERYDGRVSVTQIIQTETRRQSRR